MKIVDIYLSEHELHNAHRAPVVPVPKPVSLTSNRIIQAMLGAAVIAILALAHIHLQFTIRDMRLQHQRMQMGYRELLQQHAHLERQTAFLQDYKRLQAYAVHELGMREITERPIAFIPSLLKEKYSSTALAEQQQKKWTPNMLAQTNSSLRTLANGRLAKWLVFDKNAPAGDEVR